ncbi:hypothetical protein RCL_jg18855.t2 [Rhizophagus clarus]|uniref:Uncharacterized protein n=1 Tax=Rhizophagus clarus TaxID=94130 RepID=A0A8H3R358_9GLOM|nr:hypothetical protein RCL_jg18855.t2 [Rhizophagus clarus]
MSRSNPLVWKFFRTYSKLTISLHKSSLIIDTLKYKTGIILKIKSVYTVRGAHAYTDIHTTSRVASTPSLKESHTFRSEEVLRNGYQSSPFNDLIITKNKYEAYCMTRNIVIMLYFSFYVQCVRVHLNFENRNTPITCPI